MVSVVYDRGGYFFFFFFFNGPGPPRDLPFSPPRRSPDPEPRRGPPALVPLARGPPLLGRDQHEQPVRDDAHGPEEEQDERCGDQRGRPVAGSGRHTDR